MPATLLAVDDSVTMRKVIEMTFAGEDFRVLTADSADAALALLRSENPVLVLADISLPGKSGYDLCSALKREQPNLPVLLLSSKLSPYDAAKGQAAKADDHIDKPFDTQKLIEKVAAMVPADAKAATVQGAPRPAQAAPYRAPANMGATMVGPGPLRPQATKPAAAMTPTPGAVWPAPGNLRATADFGARPVSSPKAPTTPDFGARPVSSPKAPTTP
ncbi:MAG: response regulator, partial [Polyangiaceae bacterium]|nr:response regulator [Polyangiaceae bacterium]